MADNTPSDRCGCGRLYTDTQNGLEFKWRDAQFIPSNTVEDCKEVFQAPVLCQVCHYSREYTAGRFCPKWVKEQIRFG